jgi:hypothetical protein
MVPIAMLGVLSAILLVCISIRGSARRASTLTGPESKEGVKCLLVCL